MNCLLIVTIGVIRNAHSKASLNLSFIKSIELDIEIREGMSLFFSGCVWKVNTVIYNLDAKIWVVIVDKKVDITKRPLKSLLTNLVTNEFQVLKDCVSDLDIVSSTLGEDYKFEVYSY